MAAPRVPAGSRLPNHDLPGADAVGVELGHCVRLCEAGWEIPHPQLRGARHAWATAWATTPLITNYGCTMHAFDAMYKNCGGPWFCMEREKHNTLCVTDKVWPTTVLPNSPRPPNLYALCMFMNANDAMHLIILLFTRLLLVCVVSCTCPLIAYTLYMDGCVLWCGWYHFRMKYVALNARDGCTILKRTVRAKSKLIDCAKGTN